MNARVRMYFDGACHLCSREAEHYRQRDRAGRIEFIDIAAPHFDARAEGVDPVAVNRHIHARLPDGRLVTGVDAFIAFWRVLPGYGWLARFASRPLVKQVLRGGYHAFAQIRPLLPRRKVDQCTEEACAPRVDRVARHA